MNQGLFEYLSIFLPLHHTMRSREHSQARLPRSREPSQGHPSQQAQRNRESNGSDNQSVNQTENVSVCVRIRPIPSSPLSDIDLDTPIPQHRQSSSKENPNRFGAWSIDRTQSSIALSPSHPIIDRRGTGTSESINGSEGYEFKLDQIFDPYSNTGDLYRSSVHSIVESCIKDGYNATVFAYGQTGSGKTFTMLGSKDDGDDETLGVIPRAIAEVFAFIAADQEREYLLRVSYLEIYNEALKDLLAADQHSGITNRLTIHENNKGRVHVNGIKEEVVTHPMQVLEALTRGEKARHVGATDWNERSSRSHTVFTMTIESRSKTSSSVTETTPTQISHLNLIDLAGSESAASSTERRKEGAFINKSLLALSNVISKLSRREAHVPYRDSKLTRLLQTSLSGNAKVVVICAISADARSVVETLSTLRFARRAKMVVTKAERGTIIDDKSALLQAYQREIMSLKTQLQQNSQALSITTTSVPALAELNAEKSKAESELMGLRFERIRLQEQIEHLNRRILTSHTIESNVRRANSLQGSVSPSRRRIVSGQLLRPPKKNRGRVTDVGGMLGMMGIGLSASATGYLPNGSKLNEDNRAQFQRELQLEKELESLRHELDGLKQDRSRSPEQLSPSGLELLKEQIQAFEGDKENLPVGMTEESEKDKKIKTLEDEIEAMELEHRQAVDLNKAEIEDLKHTMSVLEQSKQAELEELKTQLASSFQEQEDSLKKALSELGESSRSKLSEAEGETATLKTQLEAHEERIKELTATLEDAQSQNLEERLLSLQTEYEQLKSTLDDSLQSKISTLETELSTITNDKEEIDSQSRAMQDLVSKLESEVTSLRAEKEVSTSTQHDQVARFENERSDLQAKLNQLQSQLEESKARTQENDQLISTLRDQISKLEGDKAQFQQRADETHAQLTSELSTLRKEKEDFSAAQQQQQQETQDLISKLENEKSEAQVQVKELQSQEAKSARLRKDNEDTISIQKERIVQLETEKKLQSQVGTEANGDHESSQQQIAKLQAARTDAETKCETLKTTLQAELESLRKEKEDQFLAQQEEMEKLRAARAEADTGFGELESSLREKSDRISAQEKKIEELESERSQAEEQIEKLKTMFESQIDSLRQDKEDCILSQKQQIEKLDAERSEAKAKVEELTAEHTSKDEPIQDQVVRIAQLETELSEAQQKIGTLTVLKDEKERLVETLQSRISALETELSEVGSKVEDLMLTKATAEANVKQLESDRTEQVKTLEAEMVELKASLEDEKTARLADSEKVRTLEEQLTSLSALQKDTSGFTTKLEKLEQRLSVERNKSHEKELEVMQLIQERDQAQGHAESLELLLNEQSAQAEENLKSLTNECESKIEQAERRSDLEELRQANEAQEKKLQVFRSEAEKLKADLEKMKIERTSQEIHQEKLERMSSRFQEDLGMMKEREKDLMEKIDSIVREKCESSSAKLHEDYNSKLMHLEASNSKLETHIKGLESHLTNVSSGQRQQTTAESMETIVDLQSTIEDQNREISDLRAQLEHLKNSVAAHPLQSISNKRSDHDHYHQSTEDELNRLYHIIDQQEKRLSDAKTDLSKWQARVRSQTEIIAQLKIAPESDSEPLHKTRMAPSRRSTDATDHFSSSLNRPASITFNNLSLRSQVKPAGLSPLLGGASHSPATWQSNHRHMLSSSSSSSSIAADGRSPRPLPVPQSFIASIDDDDAKRRKERRRTIEKDMAKLKDENVVERKLNSLLSSSKFTNSPNSNYAQESKFKRPASPLALSSGSQFKVSSSPLLSANPTFSTNMSKNLSRQSGQPSPTASSFSSSQRGYYE
ncbi:hypothetical protein PTTG_05251 [Puccinia triticina 1-1 BBBD Race 1]|uniref:Kinesin motor domain-containing protein n=2 Tax=Puccinia triticina (isolate 1-1 / race 1 (BBBD)) TaxID=630390 RepID=A0A180GAZ9_PUCT1|nr:hypothetical protein PTTG_05251 [Puccinia triticina 1-1 BBBD Race 1]WAR53499.1 hypothetical protein PtB15_3B7 [Puccinia triticina]